MKRRLRGREWLHEHGCKLKYRKRGQAGKKLMKVKKRAGYRRHQLIQRRLFILFHSLLVPLYHPIVS